MWIMGKAAQQGVITLRTTGNAECDHTCTHTPGLLTTIRQPGSKSLQSANFAPP